MRFFHLTASHLRNCPRPEDKNIIITLEQRFSTFLPAWNSIFNLEIDKSAFIAIAWVSTSLVWGRFGLVQSVFVSMVPPVIPNYAERVPFCHSMPCGGAAPKSLLFWWFRFPRSPETWGHQSGCSPEKVHVRPYHLISTFPGIYIAMAITSAAVRYISLLISHFFAFRRTNTSTGPPTIATPTIATSPSVQSSNAFHIVGHLGDHHIITQRYIIYIGYTILFVQILW